MVAGAIEDESDEQEGGVSVVSVSAGALAGDEAAGGALIVAGEFEVAVDVGAAAHEKEKQSSQGAVV